MNLIKIFSASKGKKKKISSVKKKSNKMHLSLCHDIQISHFYIALKTIFLMIENNLLY